MRIMTKANGKVIAVKGDPKKYARLLSATLPTLIETEEQNEYYLSVVAELMRKGADLATEEETLLNLLAHLIADFERRHYQPQRATPHEVLRELMAANGLRQADLIAVFGSKGVTSAVVNGKRGISEKQAQVLAEYFHVSSELFI